MTHLRTRASAAVSACTAVALCVTACTQNNSSSDTLFFEAMSTKQAVTASTILRIQERWLAYLADEASTGALGTDWNGDGDTADQIAVLVNMASRTTVVLDTSADDIAIIGTQVYLVTDEAKDNKDWNLDGDTLAPDDLVLLHVNGNGAGPGQVTYVATLSRAGTGPRILATDNKLFFEDIPSAPLVAPQTTLEYVTNSSPTTPVRILDADLTQTAAPHLMALDEGLLFTTLDENTEGRDVNNDGDTTDSFCLALVDTTVTTPKVREVGLAVASATSPVRAFDRGTGDWVVSFLVDEAAQGGVSLNNANNFTVVTGWRPTQCTGAVDTDASDQVLHYLVYKAWVAGTVPAQPINTGFAGADRILTVLRGGATYVATIVPEGDDGNCTGTSLNGDGDQLDRVLRWFKVVNVLGQSDVFGDVTGLIAIANVPGGTFGISDLDGKFLVVCDEAADSRNHDAQPADHQVIGWLDPADGATATWEFDDGTGAGVQATGASWMADQPDRERLLVAFEESVFGLPINSSDNDLNDSVPTLGRFDPTNPVDMDFPGIAVAMSSNNAGMAIVHGSCFFRVDEAADNRNWNGDSDKSDKVLFRTSVSSLSGTIFVSTLNSLNRPAVEFGTSPQSDVGAAFIADESQQNKDFNADGDTDDFVVRWMRIGP
jgi:hypothetical protein